MNEWIIIIIKENHLFKFGFIMKEVWRQTQCYLLINAKKGDC